MHEDFYRPQTFCLNCLEQFVKTGEKKPGEKMPCPLCRTEFIIPDEGVIGFKKNFHIENMIDLKRDANMEMGTGSIDCDVCRMEVEEGDGTLSAATMRCLECQENLCDACSKVHKFLKLTRSHQIVKIGSDTREHSSKIYRVKFCQKHKQKILDYYCTKCRKIVCVSCFVETHSAHSCKDVDTVADDFRCAIQTKVGEITKYSAELLSERKYLEERKAAFLKSLDESEKIVEQKSEELIDLINQHKMSLLLELSSAKGKYLKNMEIDMEEIKTGEAVLQNFEEYCNVLTSKGSACDICDCFDDIAKRANELEKQNDTLRRWPYKNYEVSFEARNLREAVNFTRDNSVGRIVETFLIEIRPGRFMILKHGDITKCNVDAIVNPANEDLKHIGGVAAAIAEAAGEELEEDSLYQVKFNGKLLPGRSCITRAGKLPCKKVIHVVGPRWMGGNKDEDKFLLMAVESALQLASDEGMKTLAMPLISTGIFNFPLDQATDIIVDGVKNYLLNNMSTTVREVFFVDNEFQTVASLERKLKTIKP